jgi:hypothetical protein
MRNRPPVSLAYAASFSRAVKRLSKKYPHIVDDLKSVTHQLEQGETPGDQMQGTGYAVYKVRVPNTDAQRGKSVAIASFTT